MGGDDGRYGWLGLPRGPAAPAVIAISLIVDHIGGGIICHPPIKNDSGAILRSGGVV
jgi:hypothetical protein